MSGSIANRLSLLAAAMGNDARQVPRLARLAIESSGLRFGTELLYSRSALRSACRWHFWQFGR